MKAANGAQAAPREARPHSRRPELTERFFELRPVMKRFFETNLDRQLRDELHSVTIHQLTALRHLKRGSVTMRELARDLDVSESSATAVTDRLVRQGLVERYGDPADRRLVRLTLSPQGLTLLQRLDEVTAYKTGELLGVLSDAQLEQLVDILETLAASQLERCCPPSREGAEE